MQACQQQGCPRRYVQRKSRTRGERSQRCCDHSSEHLLSMPIVIFGHFIKVEWSNMWNGSVVNVGDSPLPRELWQFMTETRGAWGELVRCKLVWTHLDKLKGMSWAFIVSRRLDWEYMHGQEKCPINAKGGDAHMQGLFFFFFISLTTSDAKGKGKERLKRVSGPTKKGSQTIITFQVK